MRWKASRWPWQDFNSCAPLNSTGARFGGGWHYKFGIAVGGREVTLDLIWGTVRISWGTQ